MERVIGTEIAIRQFFYKKMIIFAVLILIYFTTGITSDSSCGDWEAYKDEKCFKMFATVNLLDYLDAENFCKQQDDSNLLSIEVEEKQKFIEHFLTSNFVADNVWIGLKYVNGTYQWTGSKASGFTNWATGSPKNNESYCVQIQTESANFGLWSDELCSKKNLVICEKIQLWSLTQLQTTLMNFIQSPIVPIGFIYVQLPKEKPPTETWHWMEWEDISSDYAGMFFRTEGEDAAPFGEVQEADSPRLIAMKIGKTSDGVKEEILIDANNEYSQVLDIDGYMEHTTWNLQAKVSNGKVRPRNMAIKIWRRTK